MIRRLLAAGVIAAAACTATAAPTEAATPFRVVMIGDSIGNLVFPLVQSPISGAVHWDAEASRSPYSTGAQDRASTVQALSTLQRTVGLNTGNTRNYIVVIEGAIGDKFGVEISTADWARFIDDVIYWSTNRCLVFVYPGHSDPAARALMYARTQVAARKFTAANADGGCIRVINWFKQVDDFPACVDSSGLHPTTSGTACSGTSGAQWLADQIEGKLT